jgi:hypothetical protein
MRPSELGGTEYRIKAMTALGEIRRIFRGFDRDDAMEQLLNYCFGEGLTVEIESIEINGPDGLTRATRRPANGGDGEDKAA